MSYVIAQRLLWLLFGFRVSWCVWSMRYGHGWWQVFRPACKSTPCLWGSKCPKFFQLYVGIYSVCMWLLYGDVIGDIITHLFWCWWVCVRLKILKVLFLSMSVLHMAHSTHFYITEWVSLAAAALSCVTSLTWIILTSAKTIPNNVTGNIVPMLGGS